MNKTIIALAVTGLFVTAAHAQQKNAPGQLMQEKGSVSGTAGASGYAPGHEMQQHGSVKGSVKGTVGASGYAPGHASGTVGASAGTKGSSVGAGATVGTSR